MPFPLGSVTIESNDVDQRDGCGLGVTAAMPIRVVPGLDAVLNIYAGHDWAGPGGDVAAAAATLGLRLRF